MNAWGGNAARGTDYRRRAQTINATGGHLEVALKDPDGWGAVLTVAKNPVVQASFPNNQLGPRMYSATALTGGITIVDGLMKCSTGATTNAYASVATAGIHYRPGEESVYEFTAMFSEPVEGQIQIAGPHTGGDGGGFGYDPVTTEFGVLTRRGGKRAVAVLTVTTGSSTAANATVTLNDVAFTVALGANAGSTTSTAANIAAHTYSAGGFRLWDTQQVGAVVYFVGVQVGSRAGSYTLAGLTTGAVGTFPSSAVTTDGAAVADTWTPQAQWNIETMDGTGATPTVLDPQTLNAYRVRDRYLGAIGLIFEVYDPHTRHWTEVHAQDYSNTATVPVFGNPTLPMRWTAGSVTGAADVWVAGASCNGSIHGAIAGTPPVRSHRGYNASVGGTLIPLCSVQVKRVVNNVAALAGIWLQIIGAGLQHTKSGVAVLIKGGTLTGAAFSSLASDSVVLVDTTATAITGGTEIIPLALGSDDSQTIDIAGRNILLEPGEWVTMAGSVDAGGGGDMRAVIVWQEEA